MAKPCKISLAERHNELTRKVILDAAIEVLEHAPETQLTIRAAARRANISERTVFRYFSSRDMFVDAVAAEMGARLELPPPPKSIEQLKSAPGELYRVFEANMSLTKAALHSEIYPRIRESAAKDRWLAVSKIIDEFAPKRDKHERKIAAANIRFYLAASTWYYYRFYFGFSLSDSIECAETIVNQTLGIICKSPKSGR